MELSISDLARILGKSERTIARYLKNGQIVATRLKNGMFEVDEAALLSLRPQDESSLILQRLMAIEDRLERIEDLLTRQTERKQIAAPRPAPLVTISQRVLPETSETPEGLEIATVFAGRHFPGDSKDQISRLAQTLRDNGSVPMIEGEYKLGKAKAKWALGAAGRHAFYEACSARDGFQPCADCPHDIG